MGHTTYVFVYIDSFFKKKILTNGITSHKLRQHLKESMTFLLGGEALGPSINLSSFSQNFEMDNSKSETTNPSN